MSELGTADTEELTKSRKTNPFYPTHIASAKYEEHFMNKDGVFSKTSHSFRSVPRQHIDKLEERAISLKNAKKYLEALKKYEEVI